MTRMCVWAVYSWMPCFVHIQYIGNLRDMYVPHHYFPCQVFIFNSWIIGSYSDLHICPIHIMVALFLSNLSVMCFASNIFFLCSWTSVFCIMALKFIPLCAAWQGGCSTLGTFIGLQNDFERIKIACFM